MLGFFALPLIAFGLLAFAMSGNDNIEVEENTDPETPPDDLPEMPVDEEEVEEPYISQSPEELVTAFDTDGNEIPDDEIISAGEPPNNGAVTRLVVDGSDGVDEITIKHDREVSFAITPGADTTEINIHLNSHVEDGPSERIDVETFVEGGVEQEPGQFSEPYTLVRQHLEYEGSVQINVQVDQDEIGIQKPYGDGTRTYSETAFIDLSNPESAVHFEFADDVTGDLHLLEVDYEAGGSGYNSDFTDKVLYIYQAPSDLSEQNGGHDVTSLIPEAFANGVEGVVPVATIYLGEIGFTRTFVPGDELDILTFYDFLNEDPTITTNTPWASFSQYSV